VNSAKFLRSDKRDSAMTLDKFIFGNLTAQSVPFENPIIMGAGGMMGLVALLVVGLITYNKKWTYLWKEWLTSIDHKKIGVMYLILSLVMLLRGFSDAIMMRTQQAMAVGKNLGYLPPDHYNQIFTAHGVIMIFFVAMPLMFGLLNMAVPLQIGARDVAFPYLNSLSLWLTVVGAMLVNISLVVGEFAATGWLAYPPLSGIVYSPGVGVDYYIWALQISGVGSLLSGINFMVTILKMRCPGMTLMKMPVFVWTALCSMILVALAFPIFTGTLAMLFLDRFLGMHFFTASHGGNAMMYINLIWAWGHPEVYILILPAFGIFSEVVATFSKKKLFGYASMVYATACITFLSFVVWLHHFFTMGSGANVNAFFGIATMIIAIPTGVKIFNWLFTMYRGRVTFSVPMLWTIGFISTFAIGGMTGVMMSLPPVDFQLHNSVFLVAHFHNVIIGGVVFGYFAGVTYWFPKIFGFRLNEKWGRRSFWCWITGFYVAFMPLYALGLMGMTRRLDHYDAGLGWHPLLVTAAIGAAIIGMGVACQVIQLVVSIRDREKTRDVTGDAWVDGRTLEWAIPSPAPFYNFAVTPTVHSLDAYWEMKEKNLPSPNIQIQSHYDDIHMPRNTPAGFIIAIFSGLFGFGMVWHIYWMIALGLVGVFATVIARAFNQNTDYYLKSDEIMRLEKERVRATRAVTGSVDSSNEEPAMA
jgi:cytochrome o ubiquinol oxidase subunit 1